MTIASHRAATAILLELLLVTFWSPSAAAQNFCPEGDFDKCENDCCTKSSNGNNIADPIGVAEGNSIFRRKDALITGTVAPLKLLRTYSSFAFDFNDSYLSYFDGPFGRDPNDSGMLFWWHNFYSFVTTASPPYKTVVDVRDTQGHLLPFISPCATPPCWVTPQDHYEYLDRLELDSQGYYHLFTSKDNRQYIYSALMDVVAELQNYYFLSSVVDVGGATIATVSYRSPVDKNGTALSGCLVYDGGLPYIGTVQNEDGAELDFRYQVLDGGFGAECVLERVLAVDGTSTTTQVTYAYQNSQPGLLASATVSSEPSTFVESYYYDGGFVYTQANGAVTTQVHGACSGTRVSTSTGPADSVVASYGTSTGCTSNDTGTTCAGNVTYPRAVVNVGTPAGDGTTNDGGFQRTYEVAIAEPMADEAMVMSTTDSCSNTGACSPGTLTKYLQCAAWPEGYVLYDEDKRGNFTIHPGQDAGDLSWPYEIAGEQRGATSTTYTAGTVPAYPTCDGLECVWYGYGYAPTNKEQLRASEKRASVVVSSDTAETLYAYDGGPNGTFAASVIKQGWLADGGVQYIGTFNYPKCISCGGSPTTDSLYRVLEKHGPCFVLGPTSTNCDNQTTFPITEYAYYGATGDTKQNRLETVTTYPSGTSGTALTTTYNTYDAYGNATSITDIAGVTTTYTYANNHLTTKTVGGTLTTNYTYDNGELTAIQYPGGNYEVFCYRTNSTTKCDTVNGTFTPLLQWRDKSASSDGSSWSERVEYQYFGDGTISTETFKDSGGNVRRVRQYQKDNQKRPTWEGWGSGTPAYTMVRSFDGSDNLSGIGLPFNNAPAFCGSTNSSTNCELLTNDAANRLSKVTEYPTSSATAITTQFAHDSSGNVCAVTVGASGSWTSSCSNTGTSDTAKTAYYQYDDFGNLIGATLPDTGTSSKGTTSYVYDALGDATSQTLPDGTVITYTYDQLGRLTEANEGATVAYALAYDSVTVPSSCGTPTYTSGRMASRADSFGTTYYSYDIEGRVLQEVRLRTGSSTCSAASNGVTPDTNPTTTYTYNSNGDLTSIVYPHGREVDYIYDGGTANADRISTVAVKTWDGGAWASKTILSSVTWEPYGGLEAFQADFPSGAHNGAVEYLPGAASTELAVQVDAGCPSAVSSLGTNDGTGRLRAVWVSSQNSGFGSNTGDLLKLVYSWKADQVSTRDLCALATTTPQRETLNPSDFTDNTSKPGYDQLLRVEHAEMPFRDSVNGGSYRVRDFGCQASGSSCTTLGYDSRGNRSGTEALDSASMTLTYSATNYLLDQLTTWVSTVTNANISYTYAYDADGRVSSKTWAKDSTGSAAHTISFTYGLTSGNSAVDTIKTVTLQDGSTSGTVYTYLYDAFQRRRYKEYPLGAADEYFYDLGHQLLEDRGSSTVSASAPYPEDDYVWLDGRPVAYVRGQITSTWHRNSDSTSTCSRLGDNLPCGVYYVVTDHIGKPVLALNSAAKVVGVYDYDIFGTMNRQVAQAGTGVYANNLGSTNCATNTNILLDFTQHPAASGLAIDMRARFHQVDTESASGTLHDYAQVRDGDTGTCLNASPSGTSTIGGQHDGAPVGSWVTPSAGHLKAMFYSDAQNECPNGSGGLNCTCSSCTHSGTCSSCSYPYTGVSLESADYREYQTGTTPLILPIRFPGQYYDAETDLFENWNRFYDPSVGRYLEVEPMLFPSFQPDPSLVADAVSVSKRQDPNNKTVSAIAGLSAGGNFFRAMALQGGRAMAYSYAGDRPIQTTDSNGKQWDTATASCKKAAKSCATECAALMATGGCSDYKDCYTKCYNDLCPTHPD